MRSKISCFNGTLFRKDLTRFWPLWGLASFLGALFPLALLLDMVRRDSWSAISSQEFTRMYYETVGIVPVISLVYAVLCALAVWGYLYSARSVGAMHALPVRREGLFLTNFLAGLSMMLIPYAVTGTLCIIVSLCGGAFDIEGLLITILAVAGESFFYFASATFAAFITGNAFAMPALYGLLHFLAALLDWLISSFAQGFIFGFSTSYTGAAEWLSPTVYLLSHVHSQETYTQVQRIGDGVPYTDYVLSDVALQDFWLVGVYALAGAVLVALALLLYRRRRSEAAGDVVAVGWLRPVFRYGVAGLTALLGGQLLYSLFWYSFQDGTYYDAIPMVVCLLVAGTIGYYGASMLLAKSLRVFRGSWKGLGLVLVGCVGVCCVLRFDLLGVAARVPAASQVQSLGLSVAGNTYRFTPEEDGELVEQVRAIHQAVIADETYILGMQSSLRAGAADIADVAVPEDVDETYTGLRLTYQLDNGSQVERWYSLPITRDRLTQPDTYDSLLDQLVNSEVMKARRLHLDDGSWTVDGGSLYVEAREEGYDLGSREAASILAAVERDMAADNWGDHDWFDTGSGGDYALSLDLSYIGADEESYDWITIAVSPEMTETVACLERLGLVEQQDLVTYQDLYPDVYDTATEWTVPA